MIDNDDMIDNIDRIINERDRYHDAMLDAREEETRLLGVLHMIQKQLDCKNSEIDKLNWIRFYLSQENL